MSDRSTKIQSDPLSNTPATEETLQKQLVTTETDYNITLTLANTEYSQALPADTKKIEFQNRGLFDLRFSFVTGKVATPTAPYNLLRAGEVYWETNLDFTSKTLYFASSNAGDVVELICYT